MTNINEMTAEELRELILNISQIILEVFQPFVIVMKPIIDKMTKISELEDVIRDLYIELQEVNKKWASKGLIEPTLDSHQKNTDNSKNGQMPVN